MRTLTVVTSLAMSGLAYAQAPTPVQPVVKPVQSPVKIQSPSKALVPSKNQIKITPKTTLPKEVLSPKKDQKPEPPLPPVVGKDGMIAKVNGVGIPLF